MPKIHHQLSTLFTALLIPATPLLLLNIAISTGTILISQMKSQAQSAEAVAKVAQAITVRVEGATQGSGVLVNREGNRYTVLTAWHVVRDQKLGEEIDIYTPDGQRHLVEQGSIKQVGNVDMTILTFYSPNSYAIASVGDAKSVSMGSPIFVSGFPLLTQAVNARILRFLKGDVIANATVPITNGYQLLYSNPTLPGMSGGAVLNVQGQLVGIHGQAETDTKMSEQQGIAVKTGTNQAVPISYYRQYSLGDTVPVFSQATTVDDFLAQSQSLSGKRGSEPEVIRLSNQALAISQSAEAYFYRAYAKFALGDKQGAISDYTKSISIDSQDTTSYFNRAYVKLTLGDAKGAIDDYNKAIIINPQLSQAYNNRGAIKQEMGDIQGAIADYNKAIAIEPQLSQAYYNRGDIKLNLGDNQGAITDYNQAIIINPQYAFAYNNRGIAKQNLGDIQGAIADYTKAIASDPQLAKAYNNRCSIKQNLEDNYGAIDDCTKAISINPKYALAYKNRGIAKQKLGDVQGAIADYTKAIAIDPQDAQAYYNRGIVYIKIGNLSNACKSLHTAVSLGRVEAAVWVSKQCQ